jgi:hypothetical protein
MLVASRPPDRESLCRVLGGKSLFGTLCGVYALTLSELKTVLQSGATKKSHFATVASDEGNFRKQRRKKRVNSSESGRSGSMKKLNAPKKKT